MIPPFWFAALGFVCFVSILTPSTRTLPSFLFTAITLPSLSLSFPAMTFTVSPLLIFIVDIFGTSLQYFRSKGNDLHEVLLSELTGYWSKNTCSTRIQIIFYNNSSIFIESDVGTVFTTCTFYRTDNYSLYDITFFNNAAWCCIFNSRNDHIADARISSCRTAKHADTQ